MTSLNFTMEGDLRVGEDVEIECRATGVPTPTVTWRKDGAVLMNGSGILISSPVLLSSDTVLSLLSIISTDSGDDGQYTCNAKNHVGYDSLSIQLNLFSKQPNLQYYE